MHSYSGDRSAREPTGALPAGGLALRRADQIPAQSLPRYERIASRST